MSGRVLAVILVAFLTPLALAQGVDPLREVRESHIKGNVPKGSTFDAILKRDLAKYFKSAVKYEFLRDGPTQTGISFPKYYLWVTVSNRGKRIKEGAVRVAAIERKQFDVTDFLSASEIRRDPSSISLVFPTPVCDRIAERLQLRR